MAVAFISSSIQAARSDGRSSFDGRVLKEMGLGSHKAVSLAKAREIAADCRAEVAAGENPIEARKARKKLQEGIPTFGACADALIEAKEGAWRNAKHRYQWRHTLISFYAGRQDHDRGCPRYTAAVVEVQT